MITEQQYREAQEVVKMSELKIGDNIRLSNQPDAARFRFDGLCGQNNTHLDLFNIDQQRHVCWLRYHPNKEVIKTDNP